MNKNDLLRKIKSLLALSNDPRGNEAESYAAMLAARRLMIKYHIDSSEVLEDNDNPVVEIPLSYTFNKRYSYYALYLSAVISNNNRCKVLSSRSGSRSHRLFIVGEKDDAEYVRSVCEYAYSIIQKFLSEIHSDLYSRGYRRDLLVDMKNSWAYGYIDGLRDYYIKQTENVDGGALMCVLPDTVVRYMAKYDTNNDDKEISIDKSLYQEGYDKSQDFFEHDRIGETKYFQEVV